MSLKGACIFGQSGGPTSVINASAYGVFSEALINPDITQVIGAAHGIKGVLNDELFDISKEDARELDLLRSTPSSALGSCRYKLKDPLVDDSDYKRILEIFKKYDVRYFFYNGGNDSMDTCNKISKYLIRQQYECRVIGIPKTIDNDLYGTDHCPGFGSAAKYIAATTAEIYLDATVYDTGTVTIIEAMGRNAGWLTAASSLSALCGCGPDLIYLPEMPFDINDFIDRVKTCYAQKKNCIAVISEGIKDKNGIFIAEYANMDSKADAFGHKQMGGSASYLASIVKETIGAKVRAIEYSLMQRCAAHCASKTDVDEAVLMGVSAVQAAVSGITDKMVAISRDLSCTEYRPKVELLDLTIVANSEKKFPIEWITEDGTGIMPEFYDYALPLIEGENHYIWENGLPRFANLKKIKAQPLIK
ncbi:MAG: 6-phosphofructokinase [Clostridiaceae bacterium]|nr:6-phosphofructokinase [Clostridiaceae bacterium]